MKTRNMVYYKLFSGFTSKTILLALIIFTFSGKPGLSQNQSLYFENREIDLFFRNLYNFSFREADSMALALGTTNIDAATIYNLKANLAWWKLLSGDEIERNIVDCNNNIDESLDLLSHNKQFDNISLTNIVYAYSLKARLENYSGHTLKSLPYFYNSLSYMDKCFNEPVKDENMYLILGLYLYFIDYIEEEYFLMNAVFFSFREGDKTMGIKYLEDCTTSKNEVIRTEANYFLLKIYSSTEKDYLKAYKNVIILTQWHPNNLVYSMEQLKLLILLNRTVEARELQSKLLAQIDRADYINNVQKKHFISQIRELKTN